MRSDTFPANKCKRKQITAWFGEHDQIGFSCFVQSPFGQADTHRERAVLRKAGSGELISNPEDGQDAAVELEGALIEIFRLRNGRWPEWNSMGGAVEARGRVGTGSEAFALPMLDGTQDSLFRARRTIRELAIDDTAAHSKLMFYTLVE